VANDEGPRLRLVDPCGDLGGPQPIAEPSREPWAGPPWPHPDDVRLKVVVDAAVAAYESGETDAHGAILHAAVHGWYEGHLDASED
jgi:hypothetical protein